VRTVLLSLALAAAAALACVAAPAAAQHHDRARRIDLAVQGADVRDVVRLIADAAGLNVVVDDDVSGTVTVSLHHVRWQDALRAVLQAKGLDVERTDGILRVASAETLARERQARIDAQRSCEETAPLRTRLYRLSYADADSVAAHLRARLSPRGTVEVDTRTNTVIVRDVDCE
jgi:type IV pilus assembly protein PilQ